jgi:hypothetical protein
MENMNINPGATQSWQVEDEHDKSETYVLTFENQQPGAVPLIVLGVMDLLSNPDVGDIAASLRMELSLTPKQLKLLEAHLKAGWWDSNVQPAKKRDRAS